MAPTFGPPLCEIRYPRWAVVPDQSWEQSLWEDDCAMNKCMSLIPPVPQSSVRCNHAQKHSWPKSLQLQHMSCDKWTTCVCVTKKSVDKHVTVTTQRKVLTKARNSNLTQLSRVSWRKEAVMSSPAQWQMAETCSQQTDKRVLCLLAQRRSQV